MKKIVKVKHCIIIWNVEYIKMFHVDSGIVSSVLSDIDTEYGEIVKMTITRGKIHNYLRMTINYSSPGKLNLFMVNYIGKMIDYIP